MNIAKQAPRKSTCCFPKKTIQAAALFAAVALTGLGWSNPSQAEEYLQIYRASTAGVSVGSPDGFKLARPGTKIRLRQDIIQLAPDNKSWVALQYLRDGVVRSYAGLLLKTIPSWQGASYRFPCTLSGKVHVTWRPVVGRGFRACSDGLVFVPTSKLATSETRRSLPPEFKQLFAAVSWPPFNPQKILW